MTYESGWQLRGRCSTTDPTEIRRLDQLFFSSAKGRMSNSNKQMINELCGTCPVRHICFMDALVHDEDGVWGGTTKEERYSINRETLISAIDEALIQGWFQPHRLSEKSPIHEMLRLRRIATRASLVVVDQNLDFDTVPDFELPQYVEPMAVAF